MGRGFESSGYFHGRQYGAALLYTERGQRSSERDAIFHYRRGRGVSGLRHQYSEQPNRWRPADHVGSQSRKPSGGLVGRSESWPRGGRQENSRALCPRRRGRSLPAVQGAGLAATPTALGLGLLSRRAQDQRPQLLGDRQDRQTQQDTARIRI